MQHDSKKIGKIRHNQAKSEQGFDLGHSQDHDSKNSRKQAKDKVKDNNSQDYDTTSK
jgi:hypothetical protein